MENIRWKFSGNWEKNRYIFETFILVAKFKNFQLLKFITKNLLFGTQSTFVSKHFVAYRSVLIILFDFQVIEQTNWNFKLKMGIFIHFEKNEREISRGWNLRESRFFFFVLLNACCLQWLNSWMKWYFHDFCKRVETFETLNYKFVSVSSLSKNKKKLNFIPWK